MIKLKTTFYRTEDGEAKESYLDGFCPGDTFSLNDDNGEVMLLESFWSGEMGAFIEKIVFVYSMFYRARRDFQQWLHHTKMDYRRVRH